MIWVIVVIVFLWPIWVSLLIGLYRLFVLGPGQTYPGSIKDPSILKKGDIVLVGHQNVCDAWYIQISNVLTRRMHHRFWTHAALYRGGNLLWEAQPEGIIEKNINVYIQDGSLVRAFRHKHVPDEKIFDQAIEFCKQAHDKGYKYGIRGLIFFALSTISPIGFNFIFDSKRIDKLCNLENAYFCSELVVDAFNEAGYPVTPFDGWRVKPSDFISNPILEPVEPVS